MKRHALSFFEKDLGGDDFPPVAVPMFFSGVALIVGFVMIVPPMTTGAPVVFFSALATLLGLIILHNTAIYRVLGTEQKRMLRNYQQLPKEIKKQVPFSVETVSKMSSKQASDCSYDFISMREKHQRIVEERNRYSGPAFLLNESIREIKSRLDDELTQNREVNREIERML